ncbi:MAG: hypothetical protein ACE5HO_02695, partial [bacterium]
MTIELNENHRRALSSALREVERSIDGFEHLVESARAERATEALDAGKVLALVQSIELARQVLQKARSVLGVSDKKRVDPVWVIRVGVSRLWEVLEDCKSEQMRGYGEVPEASRQGLDEQIQALIDALQAIDRSVT